MSELRAIVNKTRDRERLTPKQAAFIREFLNDPTNAKAAAVRAGYSPRSAQYSARYLLNNDTIQSILAQHFIDKEQEVSDLLALALVKLRDLADHEDPFVRLKGISAILQYTKVAKGILGLQVDRKPELPDVPEQISEEDLVERLEDEARKIRYRITQRQPAIEVGEGTGALPN